jgi:hypothetical protein
MQNVAKMSRDKGKVGEREVAALLRAHGFEGKRGVQYKGGPGSPDVTGLPGFHIEVKRTEKFALWAAMDQSKAEASEGETPIVMHRPNGKGWVVVIDADEFLALVKEKLSLGAALLRGIDRVVNPPVIVKEQPEESDYEILRKDNAKLRSMVRDLEDELEAVKGEEEF